MEEMCSTLSLECRKKCKVRFKNSALKYGFCATYTAKQEQDAFDGMAFFPAN